MPAGSCDVGSNSQAHGDDPPSHVSCCSYHWFHTPGAMLVVVILTGFLTGWTGPTMPMSAFAVIALTVSMSGPRSAPSVDG